MLLNLYLLRAVVQDVPMAAVYGEEQSNLSVRRSNFSVSYQERCGIPFGDLSSII